MRWTVLIALKGLPEAKSRLAAASPGPDEHGALVAAIRTDTVAAAARADGVARVVLVADRPGLLPVPSHVDGVSTVVQHSPGLNGALRDGADLAAARWPDDGIVALVGDLPALRPSDLGAVLAAAEHHERAYVVDAAGSGTTLLAAHPGAALRPEFGPGSAARHGVHAVALAAADRLRCDVDTAEDLEAALALGVGPATAALLGAHASTPCSSPSGIVAP
ncbi:2-phospho-L-lactate guanylyltransferase [Jatrophihabitans endophyticus]|uniref:2-phospho-L-lactate guanylyltransferase n=1 Tax=Jatrophihabitans endophyticus TaxID=1206085 RepID=UPI0019DA68E7|nr:2-phospho-L-lactate guanylyltransferase [Jatrophihabitans endophyticus]MBE7187948.1 2-phospho-L-lactate guanylyltransferase [Jatrophihabitans endophyticus]